MTAGQSWPMGLQQFQLSRLQHLNMASQFPGHRQASIYALPPTSLPFSLPCMDNTQRASAVRFGKDMVCQVSLEMSGSTGPISCRVSSKWVKRGSTVARRWLDGGSTVALQGPDCSNPHNCWLARPGRVADRSGRSLFSVSFSPCVAQGRIC